MDKHGPGNFAIRTCLLKTKELVHEHFGGSHPGGILSAFIQFLDDFTAENVVIEFQTVFPNLEKAHQSGGCTGMLRRAQPLFPILAVSFSFLFLVPWQRCKAESSSRITNVSWNLLPETKISPETFLVWFPCWLEKGFYLFLNWKRCINTLKSRGASLRKGRNLTVFPPEKSGKEGKNTSFF